MINQELVNDLIQDNPNSSFKQALQHVLVIEDEKGKRVLSLQSVTFSIGRDSSSSIVVHSSRVSRQHAILLRITTPGNTNHQFRIIDGNLQGRRSTNGFTVNGIPCISHDLQHGDRIVFSGEVNAWYYTAFNSTDIEFLSNCENEDLSGFLSTLYNPFSTLNGCSPEEQQASNEVSITRLASIPELFIHPIIEINLSGDITYLNPAAADLFPDLPLLKAKHPVIENIIDRAVAAPVQHFVREIEINTKVYEQSVHSITESDLIRMYLVEITERKEAEQALRQVHDDLELRVKERTFDLQLSNQKLQAEIAERMNAQEEVHFLQQITQEISVAQDLSSALKVALKLICEATGWDFGESWIPSYSGEYLEYGAVWHQEVAELDALVRYSQTTTFAPQEGLPGRVWQTQKPEWLYEISHQPKSIFLRSDQTAQSQLTTGFGIPVTDNQQVVAVLVFFMAHLSGNQLRQVQLVSAAAQQVGSLIRRKKTEGALRSSLATNTALLKALPDWMFRISLSGIVVNSKAAKNCVLPFTSENFLGKNLQELLSETAARQIMAAIAQAKLTKNLEVVEYQLDIAGEAYEFEARFSLSEKDEIIAIIRDITERKKTEANIQSALNREKELNELKTRFVSMTSHEFRTPLATILASAELLEHYRHKWSEEKNLTHLQRIQSSTTHMTDLLNDVLLIGTAEAGKLEFSPLEINLVKFCQDLTEEIQLSTRTHRIHFEAACNPLIILSDQKLLRQIFYNLLSNAIKYSPGKENIYLTIICEGEEAVISIRDEGIGISENDILKVFNSFDRGSNVGNISGTGLGLPIVKKALDMHGGTITLNSELNQGSIFTLTLPLARC
jgi:signal transduction histidine kinase